MGNALLFLSVFVACLVEAVEATTIVLAVGVTRQWRSTWQGVAAALIVLAATVAILGPALTVIPIGALRLFVGALLLIFGLQWLRKAILRASGYKPQRDEDVIYGDRAADARAAAVVLGGVVDDWYAFTVSFKGVLLEGLEVAFIVVTFGANQHNVPLAAVAAAVATVAVVATGIAVRAPLSRVPENTLKFAVGILLTGFGTFWATEGAGATWPGNDAALLGVIVAISAVSFTLVARLRRTHVDVSAMRVDAA